MSSTLKYLRYLDYYATTYKKARQRCVWIVSRVEEENEVFVLLNTEPLYVCLTHPFVSRVMYASRTLRIGYGFPDPLLSPHATLIKCYRIRVVVVWLVEDMIHRPTITAHSLLKLYVHPACKKTTRSCKSTGFPILPRRLVPNHQLLNYSAKNN